MAGDWIKLDHSSPDKPEVWKMARMLKVTPEAVVGHLVRVWVWADQQCVNVERGGDAIVDIDPSTIDVVAHLQGFADAMLAVKWLRVENGMVVFPSLQSYISETAKIRALRNRASHKYRAKKDTNVEHREVEEKTLPPKSPADRGGLARRTRRPKGNGLDHGGGTLSDQAVQSLGIKFGMQANPGESMDAYRGRVLAEGRKREGS
jgi:hypothetical protein